MSRSRQSDTTLSGARQLHRFFVTCFFVDVVCLFCIVLLCLFVYLLWFVLGFFVLFLFLFCFVLILAPLFLLSAFCLHLFSVRPQQMCHLSDELEPGVHAFAGAEPVSLFFYCLVVSCLFVLGSHHICVVWRRTHARPSC